MYKWIVKGRRSLDKWDNLYKQGSHLIYGWAKLDTLSTEFPEWSWSYEWDEDGKSKRLGKGWQKKSIWNNYPGGVKAWIDDLKNQRVFPRHVDALAQVFPQALPVERRADEVERWKRQVIAQELKVAEHLAYVEEHPADVNRDVALDEKFPQYTHSCSSFSGCPMIPICWENAPAEAGELYQIRVQNHPESGGDDE